MTAKRTRSKELTPDQIAAKNAEYYIAKKKQIDELSKELDQIKEQLVLYYTAHNMPPQGLSVTVVYGKPTLLFPVSDTKTLIDRKNTQLMTEFPDLVIVKESLDMEALAAEADTNKAVQNSLIAKGILIKTPEPSYRIGVVRGS
jgi:hypothetical protein